MNLKSKKRPTTQNKKTRRGRWRRGGRTIRRPRPDEPLAEAPAQPLRHPGTNDEVCDLLRAMLQELRGLRADLRKRTDTSPELVDALKDYFGGGRFTVAGVLSVVDDEPISALATAVEKVVDLSASYRSRSTALGTLLSRLTDVEVVAEQRGCAVYRLRTSAE